MAYYRKMGVPPIEDIYVDFSFSCPLKSGLVYRHAARRTLTRRPMEVIRPWAKRCRGSRFLMGKTEQHQTRHCAQSFLNDL